MTKRPRLKPYRCRYVFWLNHNNPDELAVADTIEYLKNERSFASTVRDGIMLVNELRQGKTELLLKLYPWIATTFTPAGQGDSAIYARIEERLDALASQLQQPAVNAPHAIHTATFVLPTANDDDDLSLIETTAAAPNMDAGQNFLRALQGLNAK